MSDPDPDPDEFTAKEAYVLSYYRDGDRDGIRAHFGYDMVFVLSSLVCFVLATSTGDQALGYVAYTLLFGRLSSNVLHGGESVAVFKSIIRKYDAKLKAAQERQKMEP